MAQHRDIDHEPNDLGAPGPAALARASHMVTIEGKSGGTGKAKTIAIDVRRFECECRLDYLRTKGTLTHDQWQAGMMFRRHWFGSRSSSCRTSSYGDRVQKSYSVLAIDEKSYGALRMDEANLMLSADEWLVVTAVCGEDQALEWINGIRDRRRTTRLKSGLTTLADAWVRPVGELRG